jgi:hypothetical protein
MHEKMQRVLFAAMLTVSLTLQRAAAAVRRRLERPT